MMMNKNLNRNYPGGIPLTPILNQREKSYSTSRFPLIRWLLLCAVLTIDLQINFALNNTNTSNHSNSDLRQEKTIPKQQDEFSREDVELSQREKLFQITEHHLGDEFVCGGLLRNNGEIGPILIKSYVELVALRNCTVVEGSLKISSFKDDISKVSFPKLVEVTGYLLIYRLQGLTTLSNLFPNLSVIGGQKLYSDQYALVVYECYDLEDLGLRSLTAMRKGAIRIERNPKLCYLETVDWNQLQDGIAGRLYFVDNQNPSVCLSKLCHYRCPSNCWSPNENGCQRICNKKCLKNQRYCAIPLIDNELVGNVTHDRDANCCDRECLGGCIDDGGSKRGISNRQSAVCIACKHFHYGGSCRRKCPAGTLQFENRRCISSAECVNMEIRRWITDLLRTSIKCQSEKFGFKIHGGECMERCPNGFTTSVENPHLCEKCRGVCQKICTQPRFVVRRSEDILKLRGCTKIVGKLEINIRDVDESTALPDLLEENLGLIEEIKGQLIVHRTDSLFSLDFFKSLTYISANNANDKVIEAMYNPNLRTVFDLEKRRKRNKVVKIGIGRPLFHSNNRLCYQKIIEFLQSANYHEDINEYDVNPGTNGFQVSCKIHDLDIRIRKYNWRGTSIYFDFEDFYDSDNLTDKRSLLRYDVFYKEAPFKNVSIFDGKDACSGDTWEQKEIPATGDSSQGWRLSYIASLKPWTQYAFYLEAITIKSKLDQGAISKVYYFRTMPKTPSSPDIFEIGSVDSLDETTYKDQHSIRIKWTPPRSPNGNVTHYIISWQKLPPDVEVVSVNYCSPMTQAKLSKIKKGSMELPDDVSASLKPVSPDDDCNCEKSEEAKSDKSNAEAQRLEQMRFEDELIDDMFEINPVMNIFPFARGKPRMRRYAQLERNLTTNDTHSTKDVLAGFGPDVETILFANLSSLFSEFTVQNLTHYSQYRVEVRACHDDDAHDPENSWPPTRYERCSQPATAFAWTTRVKQFDDILEDSIEVEIFNNSEVFVKWADPPVVNGALSLYHLKFNDVTKREHLPICISYHDFKKSSGYQFKDLPPGNYSIQIRATSLAGEGEWTKPKFFILEDTQSDLHYLNLVFIIVCCLLVISCLVFPIFVYQKLNRPADLPDRIYSSVNPEYVGTPYEPDEWELPRTAIEICEEIGAGHYGCVFRGVVKGLTGKLSTMPCAIKTTKPDATFHDRMEFLNEAKVMKKYKSHHVIELYGIISQTQPVCIVMELMEFGDLKTFLRRHREDAEDALPTLTEGDLLNMACDIADGMAYLTSKRHVHRDLAARNCMVDTNLVVKVADFGLSREIYEDDYYRNARRGFLPIRWMAPESLLDGVFTHESDIWSFGVVLWEMATLAAQPYSGFSNEEVNVGVQRGTCRLQTPESAPSKLVQLMERCFEDRSKNRPSFIQIIESLKDDVRPEFLDNSFFHSKIGQIARGLHGMDKAGCVGGLQDDWDIISNEPTLISEIAETTDGLSITRMWEDLALDVPFSANFDEDVAGPEQVDIFQRNVRLNDPGMDTELDQCEPPCSLTRQQPLPDLFANDDIPESLSTESSERLPASNHPLTSPSSSSPYVLPDTSLRNHDTDARVNGATDYDRPCKIPRAFDGECVAENDESQGPDSGFQRSYSPTSSFFEERRATGNSDSSAPTPRRLSPDRRPSVSSQKSFPRLLRLSDRSFLENDLSPPSSKRGHVGTLSPASYLSPAASQSAARDGFHVNDFIPGFSRRQRPRRREESHSSGMSTLSTMTTNSSRNVSIQEDDDGYVVRNFDLDPDVESNSDATVVSISKL